MSPGPYTSQWQYLKTQWYISCVTGAIAFAVLTYFWVTRKTPGLLIGLFSLTAGLAVGFSLRVLFWKCPRCQYFYFSSGPVGYPYLSYLLLPSCYNCHLPKWSPNDPGS